MSVPSFIKLSPNMSMSTLINALNTNFNQIQSQDRRKVITDENGTDRILLGRHSSGEYVVAISARGIDVNKALGQ